MADGLTIRTTGLGFPILDSIKHPITSPVTSKSQLNGNAYETLGLEVSGNASAFDIVVEGCINVQDAEDKILPDDQCQWTPIVAIDAGTLKKMSSVHINAKGIYIYGINNIIAIRVRVISVTGNLTLVGTLR